MERRIEIKLTHLIYELEKIDEDTLGIKVIWMDERFRSMGDEEKEYVDNFRPFVVRSFFQPELFLDPDYNFNIYLRGDDREEDFRQVFIDLSSKEKRDIYFDLIPKVLEDWDKNWEGWN